MKKVILLLVICILVLSSCKPFGEAGAYLESEHNNPIFLGFSLPFFYPGASPVYFDTIDAINNSGTIVVTFDVKDVDYLFKTFYIDTPGTGGYTPLTLDSFTLTNGNDTGAWYVRGASQIDFSGTLLIPESNLDYTESSGEHFFNIYAYTCIDDTANLSSYLCGNEFNGQPNIPAFKWMAQRVQVEEPTAGAVCGNGIVEIGEACDDGNIIAERCGDYVVQKGTYCNTDCSAVITRNEQCDDGSANTDTDPTKDCSSSCTNKLLYQCQSVNILDGSPEVGTGDYGDIYDGVDQNVAGKTYVTQGGSEVGTVQYDQCGPGTIPITQKEVYCKKTDNLNPNTGYYTSSSDASSILIKYSLIGKGWILEDCNIYATPPEACEVLDGIGDYNGESAGACIATETVTCFDNIKNQDETDVDCGGLCPACDSIGDTCADQGDCVDGLYCDSSNGCQEEKVGQLSCTNNYECASGECNANGFCEVCTPSNNICQAGYYCADVGYEYSCELLCGNGIIDNVGEQCDDDNNNGDVCTPVYGGSCTYCSVSCALETVTGSYCGDGVCDGTNGESVTTCIVDCYVPSCGNKILDVNEQCDDGKTCADKTTPCTVDGQCGTNGPCTQKNEDGCTNTCKIEYKCVQADLSSTAESTDVRAKTGSEIAIKNMFTGQIVPGTHVKDRCDGNTVVDQTCEGYPTVSGNYNLLLSFMQNEYSANEYDCNSFDVLSLKYYTCRSDQNADSLGKCTQRCLYSFGGGQYSYCGCRDDKYIRYCSASTTPGVCEDTISGTYCAGGCWETSGNGNCAKYIDDKTFSS